MDNINSLHQSSRKLQQAESPSRWERVYTDLGRGPSSRILADELISVFPTYIGCLRSFTISTILSAMEITDYSSTTLLLYSLCFVICVSSASRYLSSRRSIVNKLPIAVRTLFNIPSTSYSHECSPRKTPVGYGVTNLIFSKAKCANTIFVGRKHVVRSTDSRLHCFNVMRSVKKLWHHSVPGLTQGYL